MAGWGRSVFEVGLIIGSATDILARTVHINKHSTVADKNAVYSQVKFKIFATDNRG